MDLTWVQAVPHSLLHPYQLFCCRWLWSTPCGQRSPAPAPTLHFLHCIYAAWRLPPTTGLPTGLWRSTTVQ